MTTPRGYRLLERLRDAEHAIGQLASAFAVLRRAELRQTSQGQPYCDLTLSDLESSLRGKIWSDAREALAQIDELRPGTAVKVGFEVRRYREAIELTVLDIRAATGEDEAHGYAPARLFGDVPTWLRESFCRTLVFDIETVPGTAIRDMPPTIVKSLTEHAKRRDVDEAAVRGLSPFFGKVVSLAFGEADGDGSDITALVVPRPEDVVDALPDWVRPMSERELLECFWSIAAAAEIVVTYNGRGFDVPFVVARSMVHDVPCRVDLLSNRFSLKPHLDLFDVLGQRGRGPSNLDTVCWALGIQSPKGTMDGSMVAPAYAAGKIAEIAAYNREDVAATSAVYQRTRDLLLQFRDDWS